jgi:catechol 2,3-dioxygenase-like lactoylglutathione lyase family enzyme
VADVAHFTKIDNVALAMPAGGEARAREFYVGSLGFEEVPKPAEPASRGGAWFRSGDISLHLGVDPDFHAATKAHPALRCADYESLLERLSHTGREAFGDGISLDGERHCYVSDPFGNRIELVADAGGLD